MNTCIIINLIITIIISISTIITLGNTDILNRKMTKLLYFNKDIVAFKNKSLLYFAKDKNIAAPLILLLIASVLIVLISLFGKLFIKNKNIINIIIIILSIVTLLTSIIIIRPTTNVFKFYSAKKYDEVLDILDVLPAIIITYICATVGIITSIICLVNAIKI